MEIKLKQIKDQNKTEAVLQYVFIQRTLSSQIQRKEKFFFYVRGGIRISFDVSV